ncbi:MAG: hypothetical protein QXQ46_10065 [Thermoplasmatales archaeon]
MSIIPARNEDGLEDKGPIQEGDEEGLFKKKYHRRSKVEIIFSVIKRTMGDGIRS